VTAGILFVSAVADPARRATFDEWYDRVHLPGRMTVPGFRRAWRFQELTDNPVAATACIYELDSPEVLDSEPYLDLQAETADDTAVHLVGLTFHRIVGELAASPRSLARGEVWPRGPGAIVRATLERRHQEPSDELAVDPAWLYTIEWGGAPAQLRLEDADPKANFDRSDCAYATWLFGVVAAFVGSSSGE
jgi:hypothetical protein